MRSIEHDLPGFIGFAGDMQSRIAAVGDTDDGEIPLQWTPEHVQNRMVEAFRIVHRESRVGPRQHANGWPDYQREFGDLTALIEDEELAERRKRPSSDEVSRMNEALRWPMDHIDGMVLASDALMLWAYAKATGREMDGMLHQRKKRATAMAAEAMRRANAPAHYHPETGELADTRSADVLARNALRIQIACEVANGCNAQMARSPKTKHAEIRLQAQAAFRARCRDHGCLPVVIKPIEAMPGRVMARTTLDRQRKIAAAAIASRLRRDGVPVR